MKSDVLFWPEDLCGKEKLLKFKQFVSQLLRFHIQIPHGVFFKITAWFTVQRKHHSYPRKSL